MAHERGETAGDTKILALGGGGENHDPRQRAGGDEAPLAPDQRAARVIRLKALSRIQAVSSRHHEQHQHAERHGERPVRHVEHERQRHALRIGANAPFRQTREHGIEREHPKQHAQHPRTMSHFPAATRAAQVRVEAPERHADAEQRAADEVTQTEIRVHPRRERLDAGEVGEPEAERRDRERREHKLHGLEVLQQQRAHDARVARKPAAVQHEAEKAAPVAKPPSIAFIAVSSRRLLFGRRGSADHSSHEPVYSTTLS